jgi:myo-inositol-1(or 4)-monophosphatase
MFNRLVEVVLKAGEIFKEGFNSSKSIEFKGKKDLVTQYDVKIENFIKNELNEFNFIAEESKNSSDLSNTIILDPIDGTTNFVHQLPFCAISLCYYKNNLAQIAIVYNPILHEFFTAQRGKGAYLNGKKIEVSNEENFQNALISTGFPYTSSENKDDLKWVVNTIKNILPKCRDIRRFGSASLDLCYVACGKFDGFYEMNLKPWDTAAGALIVKEAGGKITNEKGEEYDFFENRCIVASNGKIHNNIVKNLYNLV